MATGQDFWARDLQAANAAAGPDLETQGKQATIASSRQSAASSAAAEKRERAKFILEHGVAPEDVTPNRSAPGNPELTGEEYLATVDPELARQARMYIEGRRAFPKGAAMRNPRVQLAVDVAMQADPTLDEANSATRVATRKDFTSGMMSRNLTALNTAIGHLKSLQAVGNKLNNFGSPLVNQPINAFQSQVLGDPRVNNFNTTVQAFATELAKVFKGTGAPSLTELEDWKKSADPNMSPPQLEGFVRTAAELLQSRIDAMGDAYTRGMGKSADPMTLLNPKAAQAFQSIYSGAPAGEKETRVPLLETPPEGMGVSGQDIKGYRLQPEQEAALDAYLRSDKFTPEGYADMAGAFFKAQTGTEPDQATREGIMSGAGQTHDYYQKNPSAPPVGFDYSGVDKAATENAGLGASVAQAVYNAPESAANLAVGLVSPVTDVARSIGAGKREGLYEAVPNMVGDVFGANTGTLDALGEDLGEKYGSMAGVKRSLMRDPFGVAADVSIPLTLGGSAAARLPGAVGRFGRGVATTGRAIDPLSGMVAGMESLPALSRKYMPSGASNLAKDVLAEAVALPSGVGGKTLREAYSAGKSKGVAGVDTPQSQAFTANMREPGENITSAVDLARDAVANLRDAASQRYQAAMQQFGRGPQPLAPDNLIVTMEGLKPKNYDTMLDAPHRPADHVAWQQMNDTVQHYLAKASQDPSLLEPLAVDQFKQDLYTIGSKIGGAADRDAARIAGGAYRAVRKMLTDHDPVYAATMKDYADAAQEAAALESGFSLTSNRAKPVNVDAASRKLQSILRNNANTNYGQRAAQGERMAQLDPSGTLMPTLAGQSASSWAPRGLRGGVGAAELGAEAIRSGGPLALLSPKALALIAPLSPRAVSEAAYGAGRAMGTGQRLAQPLSGAVDNLSNLYNKYPTAALGIARADQYADETDPDRLMQRYGLGMPTGLDY